MFERFYKTGRDSAGVVLNSGKANFEHQAGTNWFKLERNNSSGL